MARERLGALRQRRIAVGGRAGPADRRGRIDRRFEIVAERRAERRLVALFDREQVDRRRPELLRLDVDQLGERLRLGFEPCTRRSASASGPRATSSAWRAAECAASARSAAASACVDRVLRAPRPRAASATTSGAPFSGLSRLGKLALDLADLAFEPHQPRRMLAHRAFELVAPRRRDRRARRSVR